MNIIINSGRIFLLHVLLALALFALQLQFSGGQVQSRLSGALDATGNAANAVKWSNSLAYSHNFNPACTKKRTQQQLFGKHHNFLSIILSNHKYCSIPWNIVPSWGIASCKCDSVWFNALLVVAICSAASSRCFNLRSRSCSSCSLSLLYASNTAWSTANFFCCCFKSLCSSNRFLFRLKGVKLPETESHP